MSSSPCEVCVPEPRERLARAMLDRKEELGLTWRQVADRAGISEEWLRKIRRGTAPISAEHARALEKALEWEPYSLPSAMGGDRPPPAPRLAAASGGYAADAVEGVHGTLDKLTRQVQDEIAAEILAARELHGPDATPEQVFPDLPQADRQVDRAMWAEGVTRRRTQAAIIADIAAIRTRRSDRLDSQPGGLTAPPGATGPSQAARTG